MTAFREGQRVRTVFPSAAGHTRLPSYAADRPGRVVALRGRFPLPDAVAAGGDRRLRELYSVRFRSSDLWAEGDHTVYLDLFEDYLRAAEEGSRVGPSR